MQVTYHLASDKVVNKQLELGKKFMPLTITYAMYLLPDYFLPPIPFEEKDSEVLVSLFMSNCGSQERNTLVQSLMEYIKVDSYGKCLNNVKASERKGCEKLKHYDQKLCVISQYKFYLSFENSVDESYVTEKLWHPFKAGTVPVYSGAPNVEIFTPTFGTGEKSIIKMSDFETAKDLALFLKEVGNDREKYNQYLSWKSKEPTEIFKDLAGLSMDHSFTACRICKAVARYRNELQSEQTQMTIKDGTM